MSSLKPSADAIPSMLHQAMSERCKTLLGSVARPTQFPICSLLVLGAFEGSDNQLSSVCKEFAVTWR